MTTIAFREGVLAADTLVSNRGTNLGSVEKIYQRADGHMSAGSGGFSFTQKFIAWFLNGEIGDAPLPKLEGENDEGHGYIFRPSGEILTFESGGMNCIRADYWAAGSGRDIALGALWTGASAGDAVKAAITHDTCTGGDVTVLSFEGFMPVASQDDLDIEPAPRNPPLRQRLGLDA